MEIRWDNELTIYFFISTLLTKIVIFRFFKNSLFYSWLLNILYSK